MDERLPLGVVQRLLDAGVHDAHLGRGILHVVVDELRVVLRAHAGEVAALGLGDAQALKGVLDVFGDASPVVLLIGVGLDVGDDVVHVEAVDRGAPGGVGKAIEDIERLEAQVEHPLRLVFFRADFAHDIGSDARRETLKALLAVGEIVEAAVDVRDLGAFAGHGAAPYWASAAPTWASERRAAASRSNVSKPCSSIQGMSDASSVRTIWPLTMT